MSILGFERDAILDITVNIIPLSVIVFFALVFAFFPVFGTDPVMIALQFSLLLAPFTFLAIITYYSAKAIENSKTDDE